MHMLPGIKRSKTTARSEMPISNELVDGEPSSISQKGTVTSVAKANSFLLKYGIKYSVVLSLIYPNAPLILP